ncbi:hypothetical protein GCM10009710_26920 [Aeromicrobium alkaliterrae]|uniref:Lipoprotein n=2 Tax=Aeromicrobium alkaliterrae TaxID=302168 RepID=A0ABN2K0A8_9ACTN
MATAVVLVLGWTQGCTSDGPATPSASPDGPVEVRDHADDLTVVDDASPADRSVVVSRLLVEQADVVLVASTDVAPAVAETARDHGLPALDAAAVGLADEVERLDASTVVLVGTPPAGALDGVADQVVTATPKDLTSVLAEHAPDASTAQGGRDTVVLTRDPGADALALATAGGAEVVSVPSGDPRSDPAVADRLRELGEQPTVVLGPDWVEPAYTLEVVRTQPEQPGGGHTIFPGRHVVALYGSPGIPALGMLGEQDPAATVARTQEVVAQYAAISDRPVVGAFELIATIADADIGADGDYSREVPVETLRPWVDAAREAGLYVIIDLQPGRTDFLTQAQRYAELLKEPHVGLALDPEWRLTPDQVHLRQIGSVTGAEVDAVGAWLADLTRENDLPQKLFVLHQFSPLMISNREVVRSDRPELQVVVHVDGQGSPAAKVGTWNQLRAGAAPTIAWGWKNFVDEDLPMLTPEQTWGIAPRPDLVTYQ